MTVPPVPEPPTTEPGPTTTEPPTTPSSTPPPSDPDPTPVPPPTVPPPEPPPTVTTTEPPPTTDPRPPTPDVWRVTIGSGDSTTMDTSSPPGAGSAHGVRIYCTISHFSHDDAIVFPGQPGAAHAHMFWGNTESDAFSTGESLMASGNSTCEGGTNNRSSYWTPAVFNGSGEAVLPESVFVYYKSFGGPGFDRSTIQPIPAGLQMLATRRVANAADYHFRIGGSTSSLQLTIKFPECVAVDGAGAPILSSSDNTSHLAYASGSSPSNCPASHPYRIPQVTYVLRYGLDLNGPWRLSSDVQHDAPAGSTLHADYVAAWDPGSMDALVECNIVERRDCGFAGNRGQLPDRFLAPDGRPIYRNSVSLLPDADRTPFGAAIPPVGDHGGHGGGHGAGG